MGSQNATAELKHSLLMNVNSLDVELRIQLQLAMIEKRLSQAQQGSLLLPIQGKGDEENNIHWESEPSVQNMTHSQKPKLFGCSFCNRKFEHSGKLHRYMRIHTGERPPTDRPVPSTSCRCPPVYTETVCWTPSPAPLHQPSQLHVLHVGGDAPAQEEASPP